MSIDLTAYKIEGKRLRMCCDPAGKNPLIFIYDPNSDSKDESYYFLWTPTTTNPYAFQIRVLSNNF
jgi:hypothetical protein